MEKAKNIPKKNGFPEIWYRIVLYLAALAARSPFVGTYFATRARRGRGTPFGKTPATKRPQQNARNKTPTTKRVGATHDSVVGKVSQPLFIQSLLTFTHDLKLDVSIHYALSQAILITCYADTNCSVDDVVKVLTFTSRVKV